jgi:hypothetical protein
MNMNKLHQTFPPIGRSANEPRFPGLTQHQDSLEEDAEMENAKDMVAREEQFQADKILLKCAICEFETKDRDIYHNHMMLHATRDKEDRGTPPTPKKLVPNPKASPLPSTHLTKSEIQDQIKKETDEPASNNPISRGPMNPMDYLPKSMEAQKEYLEYLKRVAPLLKCSSEMVPSPMSQMSSMPDSGICSPPLTGLAGHPFIPGSGSLLSRLYLGSVVKNFQQREAAGDADSNASSGGALDLSQGYDLKSSSELDPLGQDLSERNGKSRRKGRAYKIERKLHQRSGGGDSSSVHSGLSSEPEDAKSEESGPSIAAACHQDAKSSEENEAAGLSGNHICQICQMAFGDAFMYSCHKGCHDSQNPFKCGKCGEVMTNARGFFFHLIRKSHL